MSDGKAVRSTATRQGAGPPSLREDDPASVARYLLGFEWFLQDKEEFKSRVDSGLPLWLEILRVVPQRAERGRLLELGSPPFHITLLLQKFRNYDMSLTATAADSRPRLQQTVINKASGEQYHFDCVCFDMSTTPSRFPTITLTWSRGVKSSST
jgi:hypothetical protein